VRPAPVPPPPPPPPPQSPDRLVAHFNAVLRVTFGAANPHALWYWRSPIPMGNGPPINVIGPDALIVLADEHDSIIAGIDATSLDSGDYVSVFALTVLHLALVIALGSR